MQRSVKESKALQEGISPLKILAIPLSQETAIFNRPDFLFPHLYISHLHSRKVRLALPDQNSSGSYVVCTHAVLMQTTTRGIKQYT